MYPRWLDNLVPEACMWIRYALLCEERIRWRVAAGLPALYHIVASRRGDMRGHACEMVIAALRRGEPPATHSDFERWRDQALWGEIGLDEVERRQRAQRWYELEESAGQHGAGGVAAAACRMMAERLVKGECYAIARFSEVRSRAEWVAHLLHSESLEGRWMPGWKEIDLRAILTQAENREANTCPETVRNHEDEEGEPVSHTLDEIAVLCGAPVQFVLKRERGLRPMEVCPGLREVQVFRATRVTGHPVGICMGPGGAYGLWKYVQAGDWIVEGPKRDDRGVETGETFLTVYSEDAFRAWFMPAREGCHT